MYSESSLMAVSIIDIIAILGFFALCALVILLVGVAIIRGSSSGKGNTDETRLIQEIHHQAIELEKRIESLEAILIEKDHESTADTRKT